jgi:hypothetical protein
MSWRKSLTKLTTTKALITVSMMTKTSLTLGDGTATSRHYPVAIIITTVSVPITQRGLQLLA